MKATLEQIAQKILNSKNIAAFGHIKTDCDSVSSVLAFKEMCEQLGKRVDVFVDSDLDEILLHLPKIDKLNQKTIQKYDLYVSLDTATSERLGKFRNEFLLANNSIKIDHHPSSDGYAKMEYVDTSLPANCLILKKLQKLLGAKDTDDINFLLLSGVLADTGCFRYNSTNEKTFKIAADMLKNAGFSYSDAVVPLFQSVSKRRRMLHSRALANAQFYENDRIAVMFLSNQDLKDLGATIADTTGMSYLVMDISTVQITIMVTESKVGEFSVSYYSKGNMDVSVCAIAFGGGGHKGAAGCKLYGKARDVIPKLVKEAQKVLKGAN